MADRLPPDHDPTWDDAGFTARRLQAARRSTAMTFFLTGVVFAIWAARIPAIQHEIGLGHGQLTIAFMGLNAGAIFGLQAGGVLVPHVGSRPALRIALPAFAAALVALALAPNLALLTAALVLSAFANSVVDVGMNAHGVAVERRLGRPILSSLHAMHPLGGMIGAGIGVLAARAEISVVVHFVVVAGAVGLITVVATHGLLPASVDRLGAGRTTTDSNQPVRAWITGWTGPIVLLGTLAFCLALADGGALDWGAVYLRETLEADSSTAALGIAAFLGAMTVGRLAGDHLILNLGPATALRVGALIAGPGFGLALLLATPVWGVVGLLLLGLGLSCLLPLLISAAGALPGQNPAVAVARVSTLGYLGSFVGPAVIGSLAGVFGLGAALGLTAALVTATAFGGRAVAGKRRNS